MNEETKINELTIEMAADEIVRLARIIESLKEEAMLYDEFVTACTELIPEGYDGDESAEAIVLKYLKEINDLGGILARLTSAWR